jgi:hypothetical protein
VATPAEEGIEAHRPSARQGYDSAPRVIPSAWPLHAGHNLRHELDRMHPVTLATTDGRVAQRSAITRGQEAILALNLPEPAKYLDFTL